MLVKREVKRSGAEVAEKPRSGISRPGNNGVAGQVRGIGEGGPDVLRSERGMGFRSPIALECKKPLNALFERFYPSHFPAFQADLDPLGMGR